MRWQVPKISVYLTKQIISIMRLFTYTLLYFLFTTSYTLADQDSLNLYLIRGIGRESGHWGQTFLQRVHTNYPNSRIHFLDLPGAGQYHDRPALLSIPKMAAFLDHTYGGEIQNQSGNHILLATSLAGNVALEWAHQNPRRFDGLILVGTSLKRICKKKDRVQPEAKKEFVDIFLTQNVAQREARFLAINSNHHTQDDSLLRAWVGIQQERPVSRTALAKQTIAGALYTPPENPPKLPILVVGSEKDKIVRPECICAVQKHLNASLQMHQSAGHGVPIDAPNWLADQISNWVYQDVQFASHSPEPQSPHELPRIAKRSWEKRQLVRMEQEINKWGKAVEKPIQSAFFWEK